MDGLGMRQDFTNVLLGFRRSDCNFEKKVLIAERDARARRNQSPSLLTSPTRPYADDRRRRHRCRCRRRRRDSNEVLRLLRSERQLFKSFRLLHEESGCCGGGKIQETDMESGPSCEVPHVNAIISGRPMTAIWGAKHCGFGTVA